MKTWVVLNDTQFPYEDRKVLNLVLNFVDELKPHGVVLNGDITDCYSLSSFSKDPLKKNTLAAEIKLAEALMLRLAKVTKERIWLGGNHEDRLRRYLWDNAPALLTDHVTEFARVFRIKESGFEWRPYGEYVMLGKLLVTHGSQVRQQSGATARAHYEKYGTSTMIGHSHRLGTYYHRNMRGVHVAYENGCLCRLDPEYAQRPNWQQGFSVVHVAPGGFFNVQQIPVLQRKTFFYGGQRWDA